MAKATPIVELPTHADISRVLSYDPETGAFAWKDDPTASPRTRTIRKCRPPGSRNQPRGYVYITIGGKRLAAHRLAWLLMTGEWPTEDIDHVDCNPADNRWTNLREASKSQNMHNSRRSKRNRSGFKGVSQITRSGRWVAHISKGKKQRHLGVFATAEEAYAAYCAAATRLFGDRANFGEKASFQ